MGFGRHHDRYESGGEVEWFLTGFSPRRQDLTPSVMAGLGPYGALLRTLGRHKTGRCCLYLRRLRDVDIAVWKRIIGRPVRDVARAHARTDD